MRLNLSVRGDIGLYLRDVQSSGQGAAKRVMSGVASEIVAEWRAQVVSSGLGPRLARAVRGRAYPESAASLDAAAYVWTKAPEILGAFERGVTIRSASGYWLAVPLPAAGRGRGGKRETPAAWQARTGIKLRFVARPGRAALLVADDARVSKAGRAAPKRGKRRKRDGILTGAQSVPVFLLVPQVTLRKRLNLIQAAILKAGSVPSRLVAQWRDP